MDSFRIGHISVSLIYLSFQYYFGAKIEWKVTIHKTGFLASSSKRFPSSGFEVLIYFIFTQKLSNKEKNFYSKLVLIFT